MLDAWAGMVRCGVIGAALAVGSVGPAVTAIAQTDTTAVDLQRENDQLRQRVARLEAQLHQSKKRITMLEAQLARLDGSGGGGDTGTDVEPEAEGFAELPSDPVSCPAGLRGAMVESYNDQDFAGEPFDSRAAKTRYLSGVQQWARRVEREFAGEVVWTVRLLEVQEEDSRNVSLRIEVLDDASGLAYGPATTVRVAKRMVHDLVDAPAKSTWVISGKVKAKPRVNRDRSEAGDINEPMLIGPFAEDGYELFVKDVSER